MNLTEKLAGLAEKWADGSFHDGLDVLQKQSIVAFLAHVEEIRVQALSLDAALAIAKREIGL